MVWTWAVRISLKEEGTLFTISISDFLFFMAISDFLKIHKVIVLPYRVSA